MVQMKFKKANQRQYIPDISISSENIEIFFDKQHNNSLFWTTTSKGYDNNWSTKTKTTPKKCFLYVPQRDSIAPSRKATHSDNDCEDNANVLCAADQPVRISWQFFGVCATWAAQCVFQSAIAERIFILVGREKLGMKMARILIPEMTGEGWEAAVRRWGEAPFQIIFGSAELAVVGKNSSLKLWSKWNYLDP